MSILGAILKNGYGTVIWIFYVLEHFFGHSVMLDTILNSKKQKYLLLQFVPPQIINALD